MTEPFTSALFTDLYELTMAQAYHREQMDGIAVFELFYRSLPADRNYLISAGLDDVLTALENWRFTEDDLAYVREQDQFHDDFLERLSRTTFSGEVYAVPDGTPVFPHEPLVQVAAPILEAQLVETLVLNQMHYQSILASKSVRLVTAADGRAVVDFGSRRAHGGEAALRAARNSYLCGATGTSNVLAGQRYGIPILGTMAHSYVESHRTENDALRSFCELYPETTLLVDTYDTLNGVRKVIELSKELGNDFRVRAIRLDSGDLAELAKKSRKLLDDAGLKDMQIFASGGLDEFKIAALLEKGAPIDGFGVGTSLSVSEDAPALDIAYKLVSYAGHPRMKLSSGKDFYPGQKQIFRNIGDDGRFSHDVLTEFDEPGTGGQPLLNRVMKGGQRTGDGRIDLEKARDYTAGQLSKLPGRLHSLKSEGVAPYEIKISPKLKQTRQRIEEELKAMLEN